MVIISAGRIAIARESVKTRTYLAPIATNLASSLGNLATTRTWISATPLIIARKKSRAKPRPF